jgi:DNA-binding CsgD family transcriptional regulator
MDPDQTSHPDPKAPAASNTSVQDRIAMAQAGVAIPAVGTSVPLTANVGSAPNTGLAGEGVTDVAELARLIGLIRTAESQENTAARTIVIGEFSVIASRVPDSFVQTLPTLSRNEAAVMRFLGWGRSNPDIGMLMNCNEATVRSHMNNAIRKLNVDGMRELNSLAGMLFHPLD